MRLLFINPPSPDGFTYIRDINRSGRRSRENTIWPQTSLAMMAAMFPEHTVCILDCIARKISYFDIENEFRWAKVTGRSYDWVVVESVSCTFESDMKVVKLAKEHGAKTAVISPHSEAMHEEVKRRFPYIDEIIDYERDFDPGKPIKEPEAHLREIVTGLKCETTFEELPIARQDLLPLHEYNLPFIGSGYTFVITSRGCPWVCIYCRQGVTWKNRVRYRPVEKVIEEIKTYNLRNVAFHADTFTVNRNWVLSLCERMPRGVRWVANSRVDTVDPDLLKEMKKAGCWMICYGVESGNDKVLQMNEKGAKATVAQARNAVRWAKEAGIKVWTYMMLGMYGDTEETMRQTIDLAKELDGDICNFALSAPYPGTKWGKIAQEKGWLTENSWSKYDQNVSAIVEQPGCSPESVLKFQRRAYLEWYLSWRGVKFIAKSFRFNHIPYFYRTILDHLR